MSEKKLKEWAVTGRTFGGYKFMTYGDASDFVRSLPDKVIEYDGEVTICRRVDGEWKDHERFW